MSAVDPSVDEWGNETGGAGLVASKQLATPQSAGSNAFTGQETGNFSWMGQAQAKSAGEQNLALYEAKQRAAGAGPSVARSALGQRWAGVQSGAGALASGSRGMSPMARRQAMLTTGGVSSELADQAGQQRANEQVGAIGAVGTLSGQGRAQDIALGSQMGAAETASQNTNFQQLKALDSAALGGEAASAARDNLNVQAGADIVEASGDVGHAAGASSPQAKTDVYAADVHLSEPGGGAHWIIREEPNFLLAVNAKDGKMRKILTGELTPEEHTQAMKNHGAGPIGSHHPDNVYAHDLDLGGADAAGGMGAMGQTSLTDKGSPKYRDSIDQDVTNPSAGDLSLGDPRLFGGTGDTQPYGNASLGTGGGDLYGNGPAQGSIPIDPVTGQPDYALISQTGSGGVNPAENWMVGLQAGNQGAQQDAFKEANDLATGRGPSFGTQLAQGQTTAGDNAESSLAASAQGNSMGLSRRQAQTQAATGQQQLGSAAGTIRAEEQTGAMGLTGELAGQSRAQDQALVGNAEAASEANKQLQLETNAEQALTGVTKQKQDTAAESAKLNTMMGALKTITSSPQQKADIQPAGDDVDQFLAYHASKISPGKVTLPENKIQGGGTYDADELTISGSPEEGRAGEARATLAKYIGGDVEAARARGQDSARRPDFYPTDYRSRELPDVDPKMQMSPPRNNAQGVQETPDDTITAEPPKKGKVKPLTKKFVAADLHLGDDEDSMVDAPVLKTNPSDRNTGSRAVDYVGGRGLEALTREYTDARGGRHELVSPKTLSQVPGGGNQGASVAASPGGREFNTDDLAEYRASQGQAPSPAQRRFGTTLNSPAPVGSPSNPADLDAYDPIAHAGTADELRVARGGRAPSLDAARVARGKAYLDQFNEANKWRDAEKVAKAKNVLYSKGGNMSQTPDGKRRRGEAELMRSTAGETAEGKARREQLDEINAWVEAEKKYGKKSAVNPNAGDLHLGGQTAGSKGGVRPRRTGEIEAGAVGTSAPKVSDALRSLSPYTFKYKNPEKNLSPKPAGTKYFGVMTTDMKKNPVAKSMVVGQGANEGFSIPAATSFNLAGEAHLQKTSDNHERRLSRLEKRFLGAM